MSNGYKKFLLLWGASLISTSGSGMSSFALGIFIYQKTGMSTMTGLIILAGFLPGLLFSPFAGALADRHDRRLLMMLGDGLSIIGLLGILFSLQFMDGKLLIVGILFGAAISSGFSSLVEPSFRATISDLLEKDEYTKASGMVQLIPASRYLLSPVLAGLVLSIASIHSVLLLDILTILITLPITYIVRKEMQGTHKKTKENLKEDLKLGFSIIYDNKGLWLLVILGILVSFCLGTVQTLMIPMLLSLGGESFVGFATTISALGMLVGGLILSKVSIKKGFANVLQYALLGMGIAMIAFGWGQNKLLVCIFGFCLFLSLPFANTVMDYLVRITVPTIHQGKAWGLIGLISQVGYVVAYASVGGFVDFIISPFLQESGSFAQAILALIGKGEGRSAAFMIILAGIFLVIVALILPRKNEIRELEGEYVLETIQK
ncbi:MFS transporter [Gemella morbillorum]|uniref:MFS transporter n=1 Tax=Gemella morbillorum TaxID=29391 RepID=UPI0023F430CC|nr:MFS transporter [Gemella morbillorum]